MFLALLNKVTIFANSYYDEVWSNSVVLILLLCFVVFELLLLTKYNNFTIDTIDYWRYVMHLYFLLTMGTLLHYQMIVADDWHLVNISELKIQLTIALFSMIRTIFLRDRLIVFVIFMAAELIVFVSVQMNFFKFMQLKLGHFLYFVIIAISVHHREMIIRKSLNYERILNVEIAKTNDLISKLVPFHMSAVIKSEKKQVDEFSNLTLLYTDMVGFTQFSKQATDPKLVVSFL